uniref:Uncharacterized protein n=1 Tax=Kryptolebias marmoratus TaxID=37003 RepID=A0A3Q2ZGQ8_KRYMA
MERIFKCHRSGISSFNQRHGADKVLCISPTLTRSGTITAQKSLDICLALKLCFCSAVKRLVGELLK